METKTFSVRPGYLGKITTVIDRLNRRATKLGIDGITFTKTPVTLRPIESDGNTVYVEMLDITFSVNIPKLADWSFVATIQHMEGGNLLLTVPGTEGLDLSAFRSAAPACAHCNLERNRADTYLVRHDVSLAFKQVGKNCLAAFTGFGKTPEDAAAMAAWLSALASFIEDPAGSGDEDSEGSGAPAGVSLDRFLSHVVAVSNRDGFRTRKQAEAGESASTKDSAIFNMEPPSNVSASRLVPVTDEDARFAKNARSWAAAIEPKSDFDHNMKVIARADGVLYRNLGIAAYLVQAYRKHLGEVAERAARPVSAHFGVVGERLRKVALVYQGNHAFDSKFGTTFIHRFVTADGSDAIWMTSNSGDFDPGDAICVDVTVKKHGDYKGRAQTVLTRVKVAKQS